MMSRFSGVWCVHWKWKLRHFLCLVTFCSVSLPHTVLGCSNCRLVIPNASGYFSSPCYPNDYPNTQSCQWTFKAPAGFIIKITFVDFDVEEAPQCMYDSLSINNGQSTVKMCGMTAKGLSFNSTGNEMIVSFTSDFSIQKKGFNASYTHVAVSLRNQKVSIPQNASIGIVSVSSRVLMPELSQFTLCFEATRDPGSTKQDWKVFSYLVSSTDSFSFGKATNGHYLKIEDEQCPLDGALPVNADGELFTGSFEQICITWDGSVGMVGVKTRTTNNTLPCPRTKGYSVKSGGTLILGSYDNISAPLPGDIYNFRLWNVTMDFQTRSALSCNESGTIINWENDFWNIPPAALSAENNLSCGTFPTPPPSAEPTSCESLGGVCEATTRFPPVTSPSSPATTTNMPPTNTTGTPVNGGIFYRISITVVNKDLDTESEVQHTVTEWLNATFQSWNYSVFVVNVSIELAPETPRTIVKRSVGRINNSSFVVWALLVYNKKNNATLTKDDIKSRLANYNDTIPSALMLRRIDVQKIEQCEADVNPEFFAWPATSPNVNRSILCAGSLTQLASRNCFLDPRNYTPVWGPPDLSNCTDTIENPEDLANQLLNLTGGDQELTQEKVGTFVQQLKKIVNGAEINASLGTTVLTVFSNILSSSDEALSKSSSEALKTIDALALKIQFTGPSVSIVSRNLALGVSHLNSSSYNGSSFNVGQHHNGSDLQIDMASSQSKSLASVVLPSSLLTRLQPSELEAVSRAQFTFFKKKGLFQDAHINGSGQDFVSFVVACSIGNITIRDLQEEVKITIRHLKPQESPKPSCVFWDMTKNNYSGGWNSTGCRVLRAESNSAETVCLCNHLTHFGVLMDLQRTGTQIDEANNRALTFITYIGCGISAICSAATLLTYIAFEKIRRDYPSKILMNLSTALLFLNMIFLLDGWLASFQIAGLCIAVAALLHFFLLATFTWMALEAVHMYIALVKVFNTYIRRYILKFCIVGWGVPAVIVSVVLASTHANSAYGNQVYGKDSNGQGGDDFCWITSNTVFYVTCVAYFGIMFLMNVAMFVVVMVQICGRNGKRNSRSMREEILRNVRSVVSLTFLLGMTWGFAFFAWGPVQIAFMYLFAIFNSLQGLFIFVFHCAMKENVQKQWRRHLCCGKLRLADNSDWSKTHTNTTKKISSDNMGKSLSSSSIGSNSTSWTSKSKSSSNNFFKKNSNADNVFAEKPSIRFAQVDGEQTPIIPVHQVIDKVKGYCSAHSDNFYKNIIMSDTFSHSTKF
ncbi:adhesion G-protein coupled receptor G6 isoform X2 [Ambystoma mexicanum]|uniref:adhesion G-protein coupled receptor G6 isoform X2 n=1 Tax=Ambystoma mexicanum TaxID=8296 RepID=UPI0037E85B49